MRTRRLQRQPARHASAHADEAGHPSIRSYGPGEAWFRNYETSQMYESGPSLASPLAHPADRPGPGPGPGPEGRVPPNWPEMLRA